MEQTNKNQFYSEKEIFEYHQEFLASKIFAVNKPLHWTSQDVVTFLKHFLQVKKIGHGGTLDPWATGLLIIAINEKTKELQNFLQEDKTYHAVIEFNTRTSTADQEGEIIATNDQIIELDPLNNALNYFDGLEYYQQPHKYSAIKVAGKKLYEYAREGKNIQVNSRKVKIHTLKLLNFTFPFLTVELKVSKGFYVRSFAEDLAEKLNTVAYLKQLTRIECKGFVLTEKTANILKLKKSLKVIKKY